MLFGRRESAWGVPRWVTVMVRFSGVEVDDICGGESLRHLGLQDIQCI